MAGLNILRVRVEQTIDTLITLLDQMDEDADLESEIIEEPNDAEADPAEDGIADMDALCWALNLVAK